MRRSFATVRLLAVLGLALGLLAGLAPGARAGFAPNNFAVFKTNSDGSDPAGAGFTLYATTDNGGGFVCDTSTVIAAEQIVDSDGTSGVAFLSSALITTFGTYCLSETTIPVIPGFAVTPPADRIVLSTGPSTLVNVENTVTALPTTGTITVSKTFSGGDGGPAGFRVLDATCTTEILAEQATEPGTGNTTTFDDALLEVGTTYCVEESTITAGYSSDTDNQTVTLAEGDNPLTFTNTAIPAGTGTITVTKTNSDGTEPVGAEFAVYTAIADGAGGFNCNDFGPLVEGPTSATGNGDGTATADFISANLIVGGTYCVFETTVPFGFVQDIGAVTLTLVAGDNPVSFENRLVGGQVLVFKSNSDRTNPAGAGFTLYGTTADGNGGFACDLANPISDEQTFTNNNGQLGLAQFIGTALTEGATVCVAETTGLPGYTPESAQLLTTIQSGRGRVDFLNVLDTTITVTKTNSDGTEPIGAAFTVYADGEGAVDCETLGPAVEGPITAVGDGSGFGPATAIFTATDLVVGGVYCVVETTVPNGFTADTPLVALDLDEGDNLLAFTNTALPTATSTATPTSIATSTGTATGTATATATGTGTQAPASETPVETATATATPTATAAPGTETPFTTETAAPGTKSPVATGTVVPPVASTSAPVAPIAAPVTQLPATGAGTQGSGGLAPVWTIGAAVVLALFGLGAMGCGLRRRVALAPARR